MKSAREEKNRKRKGFTDNGEEAWSKTSRGTRVEGWKQRRESPPAEKRQKKTMWENGNPRGRPLLARKRLKAKRF